MFSRIIKGICVPLIFFTSQDKVQPNMILLQRHMFLQMFNSKTKVSRLINKDAYIMVKNVDDRDVIHLL